MYEYGLRNVDRIFVQNKEQARLCRLNFGRDSTQVPNCFAVDIRQTVDVGNLVLWVSTIRELKRPDLFLDLAEALPSYQFQMIGGPGHGETRLYDEIKARAGTISNVEFLGFVPFTRINEYFDVASAFVNTSESEGFPNTFLQAWSRGIPTLSFVDCGARAEGRPLGSQVSSIKEMMSCLTTWFSNDDQRIMEGERCREFFQKNHSTARVLDLYERLFCELFRKDY
jgi:glycosyltransferase involved in cell wall biosynthesis